MNINNNKIIEVITDVIVRFREHEQYKDKQKAIKAFAKRCPSLSDEKLNETFDLYDSIHKATVQAAKAAPPIAGKDIGEGMKVIFYNIQEQLRLQFPDHDDSILSTFINWVIYWHILR